MSLDQDTAEIAAMRAQSRADNIDWAIEHAGDQCESAIDMMIDALKLAGCMPHGFGGADRNALCKAAARTAIVTALASANLPKGCAHVG